MFSYVQKLKKASVNFTQRMPILVVKQSTKSSCGTILIYFISGQKLFFLSILLIIAPALHFYRYLFFPSSFTFRILPTLKIDSSDKQGVWSVTYFFFRQVVEAIKPYYFGISSITFCLCRILLRLFVSVDFSLSRLFSFNFTFIFKRFHNRVYTTYAWL